jgi:hypothetical protein
MTAESITVECNMVKSKEIFLSPVSFLYILKKLEMKFNVTDLSGLFITLWLPAGKEQRFYIYAEDRDTYNCGYIPTDEKTLNELFSENFRTVKDTCERKKVETGRSVFHCSISTYPVDERSKFKTFVDEKTFYCNFL